VGDYMATKQVAEWSRWTIFMGSRLPAAIEGSR